MKKIIKGVLILLLIIVLIVIAVIIALGKMAKEKNEKYYEYTYPVGVIEKKYTPLGSSEVSSIEFKSGNARIGRFVIYYPTELEKETGKLPVMPSSRENG